ncbi:MAG: hypothetical protein RLY31_987 [Bacteroidota bacterium]
MHIFANYYAYPSKFQTYKHNQTRQKENNGPQTKVKQSTFFFIPGNVQSQSLELTGKWS